MTKRIMIQGTMSNVGKSFVTAGLCRVFHQDGYLVAPFKSQNMALNSYITEDGLEIGRAQAVQAQAAGVKPSVLMNPILLKPCTNMGSQVIVKGKSIGTMPAGDYYQYRPTLRETIRECFELLAKDKEIIVIEGAGSPAEINLNQNDLVNMGMADLADAPVILVADIDPGGVFAQIYGTVMLLPERWRERIKGIVINKFRGDETLLRPGLEQIEALTGIPVLGVLPYLQVELDPEDSLADLSDSREKPIDIAVMRFPRLSNVTDFGPLGRSSAVKVRYVSGVREFGMPDMVILPGTKSTMSDLQWLRQSGLAQKILEYAQDGMPVLGICGGYQMLGRTLSDPYKTELGGKMEGLHLLPVDTVFETEKTCCQSTARVKECEGIFAVLSGAQIDGYQIHMGRSSTDTGAAPFAELSDGTLDGCVSKTVCGTYLHGLFDRELGQKIVEMLAQRKNILLDTKALSVQSAEQFRETQYALLADAMRKYLDIGAIYDIMSGCVH